jgi:signal transduction histidine kinase
VRIEDELLHYGYLVVFDEDGSFKGILTVNDVLKKQHNLVIDCLSDVEKISEDEEIGSALSIMYDRRRSVLPVFAFSGDFSGVIRLTRLLEELGKFQNRSNQISINNIVGDDEIERAKQLFIDQLFHHTKNPIQVILSSLDLLKETKNEQDIEILHNNILSSVKKINDLIDGLYLEYAQGPERHADSMH